MKRPRSTAMALVFPAWTPLAVFATEEVIVDEFIESPGLEEEVITVPSSHEDVGRLRAPARRSAAHRSKASKPARRRLEPSVGA
jgi:hypothetical protein